MESIMKKLLSSTIFFENLKIILFLSRKEVFKANTGSILGPLWVFIDPIVYVLLVVFFFQFALKGGAEQSSVPFVAWILPSIVLFTFISNLVNSSVSAIRDHSYLLRHNIDVRFITLVKMFSLLIVHIFLLVVLLGILNIVFKIPLTINTLNLAYYLITLLLLLIPLTWIISSVGIFSNDFKYVISIIMQVEFWICPIFWEYSKFPGPLAIIMQANPFYYSIRGYRASVLGEDFGPHFFYHTVYTWTLIFILFYVGSRIILSLKDEFGENV